MAQSGCSTFAFDAEAAIEQPTPIGGHQIGGARMRLADRLAGRQVAEPVPERVTAAV